MKKIAGLISGNVNFVIKTPWPSAVTVRLEVQKVADGSVEATRDWTYRRQVDYGFTRVAPLS